MIIFIAERRPFIRSGGKVPGLIFMSLENWGLQQLRLQQPGRIVDGQ